MDPQKRIDKILDAAEARAQEEVGGLLGADFELVRDSRVTCSKEQVFDELSGKQICAQMEVVGEVTGQGCLLIGIKDAIRLGGTLIMLPPSELEEVIGREDYGEEVEDSYGEIANIIAGSFTTSFEEMYPKSCRLVRKELEVLLPAKVDIESAKPVENQVYYKSSVFMMLGGKQMGELILLLPASTFSLVTEEVNEESENATTERESIPEPGSTAEDNADTIQSEQQAESKQPKIDVGKHHKRVDRILAECQAKIAGELSAFLAVDVKLSDLENRIASKEQFFFEEASGKQILADMDVVGEVEDKSYFAVGLKDAIYLGGLLIMLPPSELESVVTEEDFSEDNQDAYGEITNIVSGVYTSVFEQQYTKSIRFVKKGLQEVVPMKVEIESDQPCPDMLYYVSTMSLAVDEKNLGKLHMVFPAHMLQLETLGSEGATDNVADTAPKTVAEEVTQGEEETSVSVDASPPKTPAVDYEKHKKLVDKVLESCRLKISEEVGALLGTDIELENLGNKIVSKEDFFYDEVSGKQVIANMDIVGDLEGRSFLAVELKDAIRIGGVLIMLPASELESTISNEEFSEDGQDAYGEIANIISGVYTSTFEEQYHKNIRFVKTDLQQVAPMKVDVESDEPVPNEFYYQSKMELTISEKPCGNLHLLLPADLFQLNRAEESDSAQSTQDSSLQATQQANESPASVGESGQTEGAVSDVGGRGDSDSSSRPIDVLLVGDDEQEAAKIIDVLDGMGYSARLFSFKDNLLNYIPGQLKAVYVVTKAVNEQSFGAAIKISSSCSVPIIAAGPEWTRTKVIKAVKYGVRDILLTPADAEDIKENINHNLLKMAA